MTQNDLSVRYITIELTLDTGSFPGTNGSNTKIITCNSTQDTITAEIEIINTIGFQQGTANVVIYGLINDDINAFTRANLQFPDQLLANNITIYAGYSIDNNGLPPFVYSGQILTAGPDYNNPSRPFKISSMIGILGMNQLVPTINPKGQISINQLFQTILAPSGLTYVPNNVASDVYVSNPIFTGSYQQQLQEACQHYGYSYRQIGDNVYVSPTGTPLVNDIYILNANNGMLGYPILEQFGLSVRMRFNPVIKFGQSITVQSYLPIANANWYINGLQHSLQNKGRKFETVLKLNAYLQQLGG